MNRRCYILILIRNTFIYIYIPYIYTYIYIYISNWFKTCCEASSLVIKWCHSEWKRVFVFSCVIRQHLFNILRFLKQRNWCVLLFLFIRNDIEKGCLFWFQWVCIQHKEYNSVVCEHFFKCASMPWVDTFLNWQAPIHDCYVVMYIVNVLSIWRSMRLYVCMRFMCVRMPVWGYAADYLKCFGSPRRAYSSCYSFAVLQMCHFFEIRKKECIWDIWLSKKLAKEWSKA